MDKYWPRYIKFNEYKYMPEKESPGYLPLFFMPQMVRVLFQSSHFHHQANLIRPQLVHSLHLWHQQCWTWVVLLTALICLGAQPYHDSACQPCAQTVAHNYTWKLGLALWVCLDPLLADHPNLHPCDSSALLFAWYNPYLLLWFWYFSPARINMKGKSHANFSCTSLC